MRWVRQFVLGVGYHGQVYLATPSSAKDYSIAVAVKSALVEESYELRGEGQTLNYLKGSPYIVRCYGEDESIENGKKTYNLLLECAPDRTLRWYIFRNGRLPEPEAARYAYQLLMGIRHIHNKGFSHGDIKLTNILIFPSKKLVKLADFGVATEVSTRTDYRVLDVNSVGCVVAKMLTGDLRRDPEGEFLDPSVSMMANDFVTSCLLFDFSSRSLTVDALICHPFIQNAITCDNEDQLLISGTVNDNPFGDDWVSEHDLFTTS